MASLSLKKILTKILNELNGTVKPIKVGDVIQAADIDVKAWNTNANNFHVFLPFSRPIDSNVVSFTIEGVIHTCYRTSNGGSVWTASGEQTIRMGDGTGNWYPQVYDINDFGISFFIKKSSNNSKTWSSLASGYVYNLQLQNLVITAVDTNPYST